MMHDSEQPVTEWIGALKNGSAPDAEQGLWEAYFQQLQSMAAHRLFNHEDGEDVALSAMKSFFHRARAGQFPNLKDRTELWPLLVQTAVWKMNKLRRYKLRKKRDVRRTMSLDWIQENAPTEDLAVKVIEEGNELLESLDDEKLRIVASLKMDGMTNAEIAEMVGRTEKTVEWRLRQIRKRLEKQLASDSA